jgi:hypothetical protein
MEGNGRKWVRVVQVLTDHEDMNRGSLELDVGTKIHYQIHIYLKQHLPHAHQSSK